MKHPTKGKKIIWHECYDSMLSEKILGRQDHHFAAILLSYLIDRTESEWVSVDLEKFFSDIKYTRTVNSLSRLFNSLVYFRYVLVYIQNGQKMCKVDEEKVLADLRVAGY